MIGVFTHLLYKHNLKLKAMKRRCVRLQYEKSVIVSSCFSQQDVTVPSMSSSVTILYVNLLPGSVMEKTTVGTTLTKILKNAVSAAFESHKCWNVFDLFV